jgi:L-seryl-tRNA(Ser) seleniumtransferase
MGFYERLGVRPVINARGMNTMAGGSLMPREALEAMADAATTFVDMHELHVKAGEHIARLIGVEAAHVTSGSAGGLMLAAAAVMAGDDPERIKQLPDTEGMPGEIVIQKCQRFNYDQAMRAAGAKLVEAGDADGCTVEQVAAVISPRTAALIYVVSAGLGAGGVSCEQLRDVAHARGLPLIVDAASTLPPRAHLNKWTDLGADLVIYSGGKGIRGPQTTGLLLGRADLIRAAAANGAPNHAVGRPGKVGKEEIAGLVTALELFLQADHQAAWREQLAGARRIMAAIENLPGVEAELVEDAETWAAPTILVRPDERATGRTAAGLVDPLRRGDPPIMVRVGRDGRLIISLHNMSQSEAEIVGRRLREELAGVTAGAR